MDDKWVLLTSLLPHGIDLQTVSDDEAVVSDGTNEIKIISNGDSYVVNGITVHFEDTDEEIVNTLLIPYILQQLDGNKRI